MVDSDTSEDDVEVIEVVDTGDEMVEMVESEVWQDEVMDEIEDADIMVEGEVIEHFEKIVYEIQDIETQVIDEIDIYDEQLEVLEPVDALVQNERIDVLDV